jgi:hypothetical protein
MTRVEADLRGFVQHLRQRARRFSAESERSTRESDVIRLIAMAVTLEHIADDVERYAEDRCADIGRLTAEAPPDYTPTLW